MQSPTTSLATLALALLNLLLAILGDVLITLGRFLAMRALTVRMWQEAVHKRLDLFDPEP